MSGSKLRLVLLASVLAGFALPVASRPFPSPKNLATTHIPGYVLEYGKPSTIDLQSEVWIED